MLPTSAREDPRMSGSSPVAGSASAREKPNGSNHSLPQNTQGKVLKYQLRDEGATPRTWDIETSDIKVTKR